MRLIAFLLATFGGIVPMLHRAAIVPPDSREARVLIKARDAFDTDDGVRWLLHPPDGQPSRQRSGTPYIVTRFDPVRPTRLFFAPDFLPAETTPRGDIGQIVDIGRIDGDTIGVSLVWQDVQWHAHTGIVLARPDGDAYTPVRILEAPGIRRVVGGPNGTIVAITHDLRGGDAPLVTVYGRDGAVLAEAFPIGRFSEGEAGVAEVVVGEAATHRQRSIRVVRAGDEAGADLSRRGAAPHG